MEREALQVVRVRDARKDDVGHAGVDEVQVREVLDGHGLECRVPGMLALEVGAEDEVAEGVLVVVEHGPHLAHVGKAIVVFGAKGEFPQVTECRHTNSVEVPPTSNGKN